MEQHHKSKQISKILTFLFTVFSTAFVCLMFMNPEHQSSETVDRIQTEYVKPEAAVCFIFLNIWLLYFISEQELGTKRMSEIVIEIEKEKDESKKRNLMKEYSLNEHTCRKEKLIRRYKRLFLITVCLICVVAGIGVAFFEIVGGLVLKSEVYAEFGTLAIIAMLAGLFLWAVSMVTMGYDDDIEAEKTEKEEKQKQEVAE